MDLERQEGFTGTVHPSSRPIEEIWFVWTGTVIFCLRLDRSNSDLLPGTVDTEERRKRGGVSAHGCRARSGQALSIDLNDQNLQPTGQLGPTAGGDIGQIKQRLDQVRFIVLAARMAS